MLGLTAIQSRYTGFSPKNADEFNSASRSVKPGLIAAGVVSAWTWAATLVRIGVLLCYLRSHHLAAIQCRCLQVWHQWAMVVRFWSNSSGPALRTGAHEGVTTVLMRDLFAANSFQQN